MSEFERGFVKPFKPYYARVFGPAGICEFEAFLDLVELDRAKDDYHYDDLAICMPSSFALIVAAHAADKLYRLFSLGADINVLEIEKSKDIAAWTGAIAFALNKLASDMET